LTKVIGEWLWHPNCYPVSTRDNHVASDDDECSRLAEVAEAQDRLFS